MHKCINRSLGNVYHLEQLVGNFFPYSQKKLGFDRPVTIIFQSDAENASQMLGKTAHYDPGASEIVLYTDNRHPKDVMRSLSHELVHHAQNCRGDFSGECNKPGWHQACVKDTKTGYAQRDPHMRNMEREAYTKGNLIFRDFEDLIKTGKINIEIDFSDSGEPNMSLKESRSTNFNQRLMKKWGFLKESKEDNDERKVEVWSRSTSQRREDDDDEPLKEFGNLDGIPNRDEDDDDDNLEEITGTSGSASRKDDDEDKLEEYSTAHADARDLGQLYRDEDENLEEDSSVYLRKDDGSKGKKKKKLPRAGLRGQARSKGDEHWRGFAQEMGLKRENTSGKISVREAKEITRRIIERIKQENK